MLLLLLLLLRVAGAGAGAGADSGSGSGYRLPLGRWLLPLAATAGCWAASQAWLCCHRVFLETPLLSVRLLPTCNLSSPPTAVNSHIGLWPVSLCPHS